MRLTVLFLFTAMSCPALSWAEARPALSSRMFCDYVADFAPQIARNRIRKVPFLRLDEFDYIDPVRSQFLRLTAEDIYRRDPDDLRQSLDALGERYAKDCRDAFGEN